VQIHYSRFARRREGRPLKIHERDARNRCKQRNYNNRCSIEKSICIDIVEYSNCNTH